MMKVYGVKEYKDVGDLSALKEYEVPIPNATGRDLVVQVKAVATNPIDYKALGNLGNGAGPVEESKVPLVVGWDASGIVTQVGPDVSLFKVGDHVMFAGDISRAGAFADFVQVDERIVGRKPHNVSWSQAASLPLTSLTAWEAMVDQLKIPKDDKVANKDKVILITGGAGGVATAAVEMAKNVLGLTVIATGSRPESINYVTKLGADHVINHHKSIKSQLKELGIDEVDYVLDTYGLTAELFNEFTEITKGFGGICSIWPAAQVDLMKLFWKSINFSAVLMFTRPTMNHEQRIRQHHILTEVAQLVEKEILTPKETETVDFNLANLVDALNSQAAGKSIGKRTLSVK